MPKFYITTPIYYINDVPHIGHAYTTIAADVLARYHRSKGEDVFFLTGVDEHGAKIAEAAKKAGKEPKEFVDDLVPVYKKAWKDLNINYSEFFRTTDPRHEKLVQDFVLLLKEKGFIEKRAYEGLYCVGCERFLKESELVDGKCPDHKREPVLQSEENYFFLLSKFEKKLAEIIESDELCVGPKSRKNETLSTINQGLEDISISRQAVTWGIQFPGDPEQTIYVWIDALLNYYTATKIFEKEGFWPADLHLIGKEILKFHTIIWPAMLLAAGLPLPKSVYVNGFITVNGQKMSKSLGNVIDPIEITEKLGADAVRYFLLREFPYGEDGDASVEKIAKHYEEDLANGLGNLVQRTISMINRYQVNVEKTESVFGEAYDKYAGRINSEIEKLNFSVALSGINLIIQQANQYINENKPWETAKSDLEKVAIDLNEVYHRLAVISKLLGPFMPDTAEKMKKQLETLKPEPLFPRLD